MEPVNITECNSQHGIRRHAGGGIDYDYYLQVGRREKSLAMLETVAWLRQQLQRAFRLPAGKRPERRFQFHATTADCR